MKKPRSVAAGPLGAAAADLVSGEELLDAILRTSSDAIVCEGSDGRILCWNVSAERLFGYGRDEILGQPATMPVPPELRAAEWERLERTAQAGGVERFRTRRLRKDGSSFEAEVSLSKLPDRRGPVVLSVTRDVTEQMRADEALRFSEQRFRLIAQATSDAFWDWDIRGRTLWWGGGMQGLFGYALDELEPGLESWSNRIHPEDKDRAMAALQGTLDRHEESYLAEYRFRRKDGTYAHVLDRGFVIRDAAGQAIRMVGGMTDLSERIEAQHKLAAHAERLARSNDELERFAYVISHDLQEPLRTLSGFAHLLVRRFGGEAGAREYSDYIIEAVDRMRDLIQGLLAYSRLGPDAAPGAEDVDLEHVVNDVRRALTGALNESGGEIEVTGPLPTVRANRLQMQQVFQNLLSNAIKFRGPEPPRIRIEARRVGPDWRFTVADNGIGVEPQYVDRIFALFQRLHTRAGYPGSGIGLAVCKKIVEMHGGRIWVEPGGPGTRFLFTLPAEPPSSPGTGAGHR